MANWFAGIKTAGELKKEYRKLARMYHPDLGGCAETMKKINAEFDKLIEKMKKGFVWSGETKREGAEVKDLSPEWREVLEKVVILEGLEIEICGKWIWIGGNTKPVKEKLKEAGFRWAGKKKLWFWHRPEDGKKNRGEEWDMEKVRDVYGSEKVDTTNPRYQIA